MYKSKMMKKYVGTRILALMLAAGMCFSNAVYAGELSAPEEAEETLYLADENAPTSGTCGDNATWSYADGVLTVSGTGAIYDHLNLTDCVYWSDLKEEITKIVVNGVLPVK